MKAIDLLVTDCHLKEVIVTLKDRQDGLESMLRENKNPQMDTLIQANLSRVKDVRAYFEAAMSRLKNDI